MLRSKGNRNLAAFPLRFRSVGRLHNAIGCDHSVCEKTAVLIRLGSLYQFLTSVSEMILSRVHRERLLLSRCTAVKNRNSTLHQLQMKFGKIPIDDVRMHY